jgi:hypothetical protein
MSHRVASAVKVRFNSDCLKLAFRWLLASFPESKIAFRADCTWTVQLLVATSLLWVWADEVTLIERFENARRVAMHLFGGTPAGSYQAFMKLMGRWTEILQELLKELLRERMRVDLRDCILTAGFIVFGVDGSKIDLPRTAANQAAYAHSRNKDKKRNGRRRCDARKRESPQLLLTTVWHVGSGLPWDWRRGPADSSERGHLLEMLAQLPEGALIAADAGFTGYEFLERVLNSGRRVLIRIGSNVRLLRKLGYVREGRDTVYLWPDRQQNRGSSKPLVFRLVVSDSGKEPVYLLTDLSAKELDDQGVAQVYALRWGVEVFYRGFKRTFGRNKLRSTSAANALVELDWSFIGLWALSLYALVQARRDKVPPKRMSCAKTLRCARRTVRDYTHPCAPHAKLTCRLRLALIDDYVRGDRTSRNYPRKKRVKPPGTPQIRNATPEQKRLARTLRTNRLKYG